MASVKMMQGDSYAVFVSLSLLETGDIITPNMVSDVEIHVGESLRKTYAGGQVRYDPTMLQWYFTPTQEETLAMEPNTYSVQARVKFNNGNYSSVRGVEIGKITIMDALSEEVL